MTMQSTLSDPLRQPIHETIPDGDGTAAWKDNAYLAFWDPGKNAFGVLHVSTSPNADGRRARMSMCVDEVVTEVIEELDPGTFASESIEFDLAGRITVDSADLKLALDVTERLALGDFVEIIPPMGGAPVKHYEQTVDLDGSCEIKGRSLELAATGIRDRTWGYRDESVGTEEYMWFFLTFPDFSVAALRFTGADDFDRTGGFVLTEEEARPISRFSVTRDASGLAAGATFHLEDGDELSVRSLGRRGGFWIPMSWERSGPTMSAYDEFCPFRTADGIEGFGVAEHGGVRKLH